jgi:hypothetical protein
MRGRRLIAAAAAAMAVPWSSPAAAQERVGATVAGAIVIAWHSDPATCAAAGLCGVSGSVAYRPGREAVLLYRDGAPSSLSFRFTQAVTRVLRELPGRDPALCVDRVRVELDGVRTSPSQLKLRMTGGHDSSESLGGRCAGPLATDVDPVLPAVAAGRGRLDFSGRHSFSAGPLAGEVISTLTVTPRRVAERGPRAERSSRPRPRVARYRLTYRVQRASGALTTVFSGRPDPLCRLLDACGVSGSATHVLDFSGATVDLLGSRTLDGRRPPPLRQVLALLELHGTLRARAGSVRTVAEVGRTGEATCRDTVVPPAPALRLLVGGHLSVSPEDNVPQFRTRCPGPTRGDVFGDSLASASLPRRALVERTLRVSLRPPPEFAAPGYAGGTQGELTLELRRTRVRVEVGS